MTVKAEDWRATRPVARFVRLLRGVNWVSGYSPAFITLERTCQEAARSFVKPDEPRSRVARGTQQPTSKQPQRGIRCGARWQAQPVKPWRRIIPGGDPSEPLQVAREEATAAVAVEATAVVAVAAVNTAIAAVAVAVAAAVTVADQKVECTRRLCFRPRAGA